jgi:hypothetical protein
MMFASGSFYELLFSFYRRLPEPIATHELEVLLVKLAVQCKPYLLGRQD